MRLILLLCTSLCCFAQEPNAWKETIATYCLDCHDADAQKGGVNLDAILDDPAARHPDIWERAVRQLMAGQMPPVGKDAPTPAERQHTIRRLVTCSARRRPRRPPMCQRWRTTRWTPASPSANA